MTPEERSQTIENMVERLATRLEDSPEDLQGWTRLIRARIVLEQFDQAEKDLETAKAEFAGNQNAMGLFGVLKDELAEAKNLSSAPNGED